MFRGSQPEVPMSDPNFYAPPSANVDGGGQSFGKSDHATELAAFVGTQSNFYLGKWAHKINGGEGSSGFSIGAFFLGLLYFLYRKMWLYALLLFGAQIVLMGVSIGIAMSGAPEILNNVLGFGFNLFVSFKAHDWYYQHACAKIDEAKAEGYEGAELLQVLSQRGGTNLWLPLLLVFGLIGLVFLAAAAFTA
jgi:uncharacterized protein DUF2628